MREGAMRRLLGLSLLIACGLATPALAQEGVSYTAVRDVDYDRGSPPADPAHNRLDVYAPAGRPRHLPVVVWVHGGAWMRGDKKNKMELKAPLFTGAGYVLVSVNYRLSPDPPAPVVPDRVRHPDHVRDVAEALAWVQANVARHGGDPRRVLLAGHSAGAHLVVLAATDRSHLDARGVRRDSIRAVVGLDGAGYDIAADLEGTGPLLDTDTGPLNKAIFWNAFGNPAEERTDPRWADASPVVHGDPADPPLLLTTQAADPRRIERNRAMVAAVGQDPDTTVLLYDKTHAQFNDHLGDPADTSGFTEAVMGFLARHRGSPPRRHHGHGSRDRRGPRRRVPRRAKRG